MGVWIYRFNRAGTTIVESWIFNLPVEVEYFSFAGWLPDYLWCLSLLFSFSLIWKGSDNVPKSWWAVIYLLVNSTEGLQYQHIIFGTADWLDIAAYQLAFITFFIVKIKSENEIQSFN